MKPRRGAAGVRLLLMAALLVLIVCAPTFADAQSLRYGIVGIPYSQQLTTSLTGQITWSISGGSLPGGIVMDSATGLLSGVPVAAGNYTLVVTTTAGQNATQQTLTLKVQPGFSDLIIGDSGDGNVYRVNPATFSKTLVGQVGSVYGVATDTNTGDIYTVGAGNVVTKISATTGQVSQFYAGTAIQAGIGIAVDQNSNVYVGDNRQDMVYKLNSSGQLVGTFAALPSSPGTLQDVRMLFDSDGNLIVADDGTGLKIGRISPTGTSTNVYTGTGEVGGIDFAKDGSGALIVAGWTTHSLIRIDNLGAPTMSATTLITSNSLCCDIAGVSGAMTGVAAQPGTNNSDYFVTINNTYPLRRVALDTQSITDVASFSYGNALAWLQSTQSMQGVTIAADSKTITYGDPLPAPTYTVSPNVALDSGPSCTFSNMYANRQVGQYAIACTGATANGYQITYVPGTLTVLPKPLTVTAANATRTYGAENPVFTGTITGLLNGDSVVAVYGTSAGPSSPVGTYAIVPTVTGAALSNYTVILNNGVLTVTQAPLTVTADNKLMGYGSVGIPPLTYSYQGLLGTDAPATVGLIVGLTTWTTAPPSQPITITSATPAGTYTIAAQCALPAASNYTITTCGNGTFLVAQDALNFFNNWFVSGDAVAAGVNLQAVPPTGTTGLVNGQIAPSGIPANADIVAAFLYWQTVESATSTPSGSGFFNGYSMVGDVLGSDLPYSASMNGVAVSGVMRVYRADVRPYLIVSGTYQAAGPHQVSLPAPVAGASLVVIYRVLGNPTFKAVVIYDGAWLPAAGGPSQMVQTIKGYYDGRVNATANLTAIYSTQAGWNNVPSQLTLQSGETSQHTDYDSSGAWGALVFSVPVDSSDGDGLLDAWKSAGGYYDVWDGSWVDLTGARTGQRDIFVQYDYMVGADGHSHQPSTQAVNMVTSAFANQGITLHLVPGNAIPETTCTSDDPTATPPLYCVWPNEPGVVAWKSGLEDIKATPLNPAVCNAGGTCNFSFPPGGKDSHHYMLFGHSVGVPSWTSWDQSLISIAVSNNVATVTTTPQLPPSPVDPQCPQRITIDGAIGTPALNGVYTVTGCTATTFTAVPADPTLTVPSGTYPGSTPEPFLAVTSSNVGTISGFSDVAGSDSAVTLAKWGSDAQRVNVQAGTLMHELGHTLALTHGGLYNSAGAFTAEPNCKSNFQSVMNYLFQIDLLGQADISNPYGHLDYSGQVLNTLDESNLSLVPGLTPAPAYSWTKWFSPVAPANTGNPASLHCDGTAVSAGETPYYLVQGAPDHIAWSNGWNIHFGQLPVGGVANSILDGYNDWANLDLRQLSATGNDYVSESGGGIARLPGGGIARLPGGGIARLPGGGIARLPGGGIARLPGGGIARLPGGGIARLPGGGIARLPGGGIARLPGGGIGATLEIDHKTANSYPHPPRSVTVAGGTVNWNAATLGNVQQYNISRVANNTPTLIACVIVGTPQGCTGGITVMAQDPLATSFSYTDPNFSQYTNPTYYVTTIDISDAQQVRQSTPPMQDQTPLTLTAGSPLLYGASEQLSVSGGSTGGVVTYIVSGPCTIAGNVLTATSGTGSCVVTATMAGGNNYNPITSNPVTVALQSWTVNGFYQPITMSSGSVIVWNTVKGGSTVPLKFNIYAGTTEQTTTSAVKGGSVSIFSVACSYGVNQTLTASELVSTGSTSLRYDTVAGQFIQNWQTPRAGGACYVLQMTAQDGSGLTAYIQTK